MKIAFPYNTFPGGFLHSMMKACVSLGHQTYMCNRFVPSFANKVLRRIKLLGINKIASHEKNFQYNRDLLNQILEFKPDIFINYSGSNLLPATVKELRDKTKAFMVCYIADNPCDPDPRRDQYFPMTLQYYDIFLNPEPVWDKLIYNLCEKPKIIRFYGGYDPENFFPIDINTISANEREELECDISFTGGSYNKSAEGAYRAGILGQLEEFEVKIWGDEGWKYRFNFYPKIKAAYKGRRLPYDKLRKLYALSKINLNMPSPQIFTGFQPRIFEIAAAKGFQIIDHSDELYKFFDKDEIVTFKSINELKEKISYYLLHDEERKEIINKMYQKTINKYTWEKQIKKVFEIL